MALSLADSGLVRESYRKMQKCFFLLSCAFYLVAAEAGHSPCLVREPSSGCIVPLGRTAPFSLPLTAQGTPLGAIILGFRLAGALGPFPFPMGAVAFSRRSQPACYLTERLTIPLHPALGFLLSAHSLLQSCSVVLVGMPPVCCCVCSAQLGTGERLNRCKAAVLSEL